MRGGETDPVDLSRKRKVKGYAPLSLAVIIGLILIAIFLTLLYLGSLEGSKRFGLFGQKKQQEQPTEAKGKPTKPQSTNLTLNVSPNPAPAGVNTAITFNGSGFNPNERLWTTIGGVACCGGTTADSKGSFTYTTYIALEPGSYTASVLVREGDSWVWAINSNFSVQ